MRVMVTGSRLWTNVEIITNELAALSPTAVIHGGAPGADTIAAKWAADNGIPPIGIPAPWGYYPGHIAEPKRNGWLLDLKPDLVLAFPLEQSHGAWDAVHQAHERGIPVEIITRDGR